MTYRFLAPALVEISEAAEFCDGQVPGLGIDEIEKRVGRPRNDAYRQS